MLFSEKKRELTGPAWLAWATFCLSLSYCPVLFNKTFPEPGQSGTENLKKGPRFSTFSLLGPFITGDVPKPAIYFKPQKRLTGNLGNTL